MGYSVINWGAFTPMPFDATIDLASIHDAIQAGHPSEQSISEYYQNGLNAAKALHDVYDPTGSHPERFKRLDAAVSERMAQWQTAGDPVERFLVADRLNYSMGVAYDAYRAKLGDNAGIAELLKDGSRILGESVGAVVAGIIGGAVEGAAKAIPWWVWVAAAAGTVAAVVVVIVVVK